MREIALLTLLVVTVAIGGTFLIHQVDVHRPHLWWPE